MGTVGICSRCNNEQPVTGEPSSRVCAICGVNVDRCAEPVCWEYSFVRVDVCGSTTVEAFDRAGTGTAVPVAVEQRLLAEAMVDTKELADLGSLGWEAYALLPLGANGDQDLVAYMVAVKRPVLVLQNLI